MLNGSGFGFRKLNLLIFPIYLKFVNYKKERKKLFVLDMETTREVVKTTGGIDGGLTVVRSNAPSEFHIAPKSETSNPRPTSVAPSLQPPQNSFASTGPPPATEGFSTRQMKKKRGRPRKYGHDGAAVTLSPNPISSAAPTTSHVIDFSAAEKRGRVKPATERSFVRTKYQVENLGNNELKINLFFLS